MGMNYESISRSFTEAGYAILEAEDKKLLDNSRRLIAQFLRDKYSITTQDDEALLNRIHAHTRLDDTTANELVMNTIRHYSQHLDMSEAVYDASKSFIDAVIGPDIASQKHPNIVFQYPFSQRYSELHTDAPANSEYEIVAWAPLVNCYGTKSFYIVDHVNTLKLLQQFNENQYPSWEAFRADAIAHSIKIEIRFGQILFFSTSLLHGSLINNTDESRWSLNTRYKNLFAPCGLKDPFTFYKVFRTSPLTQLALGRA